MYGCITNHDNVTLYLRVTLNGIIGVIANLENSFQVFGIFTHLVNFSRFLISQNQ